VDLVIPERLVLLDLLPNEGNYLTLKLVRKLREKLSFDEDELKDCEIAQDEATNTVRWSQDKDVPKKMEFSDFEKDVIKKSLQELDDKKKLEPKHMSLYEKFVGG
jgi:hypothetical protein